jgi:hypothetical protein
MNLGKIDEIVIHVVPVLFGNGTRLYEDLRGEHMPLEHIESVETKEAIHLRYRIL